MKHEKIYVVYTDISIKGTHFRHKDIYYERADGTVEIMRGQPNNKGFLTAQLRLFKPHSVERDRKQLERWRAKEIDRDVISIGPNLSNQAHLIRKEFVRIKNQKLAYGPTDTNSNWAADKALLKAGLPLPKKDQSDQNWAPGSIRAEDKHRYVDDYVGGDSDMHFAKPSYKTFDEAETGIDVGANLSEPNSITPNRVRLAPARRKKSSPAIPKKGPARVDIDASYNPFDIDGNGFTDLEGEAFIFKNQPQRLKNYIRASGREDFFKHLFEPA